MKIKLDIFVVGSVVVSFVLFVPLWFCGLRAVGDEAKYLVCYRYDFMVRHTVIPDVIIWMEF